MGHYECARCGNQYDKCHCFFMEEEKFKKKLNKIVLKEKTSEKEKALKKRKELIKSIHEVLQEWEGCKLTKKTAKQVLEVVENHLSVEGHCPPWEGDPYG